MKEQIMEQLEQVNDPELNIDIVNLGLVYDIDIDDEGNVKVTMTLTAMGCPLAGIIQQEVEQALKNVEGVNKVDVEIVWNPRGTKAGCPDMPKSLWAFPTEKRALTLWLIHKVRALLGFLPFMNGCGDGPAPY